MQVSALPQPSRGLRDRPPTRMRGEVSDPHHGFTADRRLQVYRRRWQWSRGGAMGRASKRKKIRRQAGHRSVPGGQTDQEAMLHLVAGLQEMTGSFRRHQAHYQAACREWCDGDEPVPAREPEWPEDSLGHRFFTGTFMDEARRAPSLLTASIPDHTVISTQSVHWGVAMNALVRAVAFDGLRPGHLVVSTLLDLLGPVAEAELAYGSAMESWLDRHGPEPHEQRPAEPEPEFPEDDGPASLLGTCVLTDATWALVGLDPVREVHAALAPVLDESVPGLEGRAVADLLIGAFARHYRCEEPGDAELLDRIGREASGNPLEELAAAKAVAPREVLRAGLTVLCVLAEQARSGSNSILRRTR